ncbi:fructosamine kinase family protein [Fulvivirga sp. M361]|uniref:fructosamine kinase family protein n=1 Tax=Fulvivirga sp. M361 TaxID=2594266 RepID=UPI00117B5821|nr:fructosamine kinase family protein [Fulvivirga sp. M361]TRX58701.1 fructosamine kinase family protein [Fulvivirga sp. M361]
MDIPEEIKKFCIRELGELQSFRSASGGCINNGGRLETHSGHVFLKWNSATRFPDMFTKEAKGLRLMQGPQCITVPQVIATYEGEQHSCLILEFLESSVPVKTYWEDLAIGLAGIHKMSADHYGLDHSNYMGSLVQDNAYHKNWIDFFIRCRLQPQLKLAVDHGKMQNDHIRLFEKLFQQLDVLLVTEPPALIHGDLWNGNIMTDNAGKPALIDPAVAYAHREMDLALMQLFGKPPLSFYQAYNETYPLVPDWEGRMDLYNLYALLVHVNLFGGGYLIQCMQIVKHYVS